MTRDTKKHIRHMIRNAFFCIAAIVLTVSILPGCSATGEISVLDLEKVTEALEEKILTTDIDDIEDAELKGSVSAARKVDTDLAEIPLFGYSAEDLKDIIPHYELRYFLHDLDLEMKENFLALYLAVSDYKDVCILPHNIDEEDMEVLQYLLSFECPELLHFPGSTMELWDMTRDSAAAYQEMHISYPISRDESSAQYKQCESMAKAVADTAERETDGSDLAKEKYVYDYLTSRIFYNIDAPNSGNAFGSLVSNQAKCDGISLGMKWVCEEMGIPCMILAGQENGDPIGHAWNIVGIDGEFYDVDVTLDVQGEDKPVFNLYPAFNVSRTWIRDNFPVKEVYKNHFTIPGTVTMNKSYHAIEEEFFKTGESCWQHYCDALDDALENDENVIMLQFESFSDYSGFVKSVSNMHQDWVNSRRTNISSNMLRNDRYRTVAMEITFK